jgi:hypothetical protein
MSKSEKQVGEMTSWEFTPTTQQDHPLTIVFRELSECEFPEERSLYLRNHVPFVADIDKIEQYLRDNLVLFTTAQIALYSQYLAEHRECLQQAEVVISDYILANRKRLQESLLATKN